MVEAGHFEELSEILDMLPRGDEPGAAKRQVFLFTATLHASGVDGVGLSDGRWTSFRSVSHSEVPRQSST